MRKVCQIAEPARLCSAYMVVAIRTRGSSGVTDLRPPRRPRACAAMSPARVRSWTSRRSNCASAEKIWKTSSPEAVVVSIDLKKKIFRGTETLVMLAEDALT